MPTPTPRRRLVASFVVGGMALGGLGAVTFATPAHAATSPPCSTTSIDEGAVYTVPAGVAGVRITAYGEAGARGASAIGPTYYPGGNGAKVTADVPVSAGELLRPVRIDGGSGGGGGLGIRYPYDYGRNGTRGGTARGVVKVESDCRRYLVVAGGGGGNGSEGISTLYPSDSNYGNGLSSKGGNAGLGPSQPAGGGQHGHGGRNNQEDGAGGGGASLTAGGGGGAGGRDAWSFCANGNPGGGGAFETPGAGGNGNGEDDCEARSGGGGGGAGYYGGGGGGVHQDDSSGSGAGGGGSSYVIDGASNVSYVSSDATQPPGPTIVPIYTPAGAPSSVSAVAHNAKAYVTFTPPTAPYSIASYTVTASPGGQTTSVPTGSGALTGTVAGLTNGTSYRFSVTAVPAADVLLTGSPATSSLSNAVTPTTQVPSAVRSFQATPGDGTAALSWQAPADDGGLPILDYMLTWAGGTRGLALTGTSYNVTEGLINGQTATFVIRPRNAKGDGPTTTVTATPVAAAVPVKQPTPTGIAGNGFVDVRFAPAQPGYDQFVVTVTPAPLFGGAQITYAAQYTSGHPVGLRVNYLQNGTAYRFSVSARNDKGMGPTSDLSDPMTPSLTPPTSMSATVERGVDELIVKPDWVVSGGAPVTSMSAYAVPLGYDGGDVTPTVTVPAPTPGALPAEIRIPVQSGRLHSVWLSATNSQGSSTFQQIGHGRAYVVPKRPTDLEASVPNDSTGEKVRLEFLTHQEGDCGTYVITASPGGLTKSGSVGPGECGSHQYNNVTFDGLTNGTEYTFQVHVVDDVTGAGPASESSAPARPSAMRRPDPVTDVVATPAGSGKVRVRFAPSPDPDWKWPVTSYAVSAGGAAEVVYPGQVEGGVLLTGLTNDEERQVRVVARNGVGDSDPVWSDEVTPRALATPANLAVRSGNSSLLVSFDEVENNGGGPLSYRLVIWPNGGTTYEVAVDGSPVRLTNLENWRSYDVRVYARNPDGSSAPTSPVWVQPDGSSPDSPVDVVATPGVGEVTISFKRPPSEGFSVIDDYVVSASPGGHEVQVEEFMHGPGAYSTTMTGLDNGTTYTFTVVARRQGNESLPSEPATATPDRLTQAPILLGPTSGTYNDHVTIDYSGGSGSGAWGTPTVSGDACQPTGPLQLRLVRASTADRTCTISITRAGDDTYKPRTVTQTLTVSRRALTVTAVDRVTTYGDPFPTTATYAGFVNGDDEHDLGGALTFGGPAMNQPGAGPAALVPSGLTSDDYDIEFVPGTVTVQPRGVDLHVADDAKTYGEPNPVFQAEPTNLVGDDELDYTLTSAAGTLARPSHGPFQITAVLGENPDYDVTVHSGELHVYPANLTIAADDKTAPYGAPVPYSVSTDGLVGSDTLESLNGTLSFHLVPGGAPRTWVILPVGLWSPDYNIGWNSGVLTRTQVVPTIDWETPGPITYGAPLSGDELDAGTSVPGTLSYSPSLGTKLSAGTHDLTVTFTPADTETFVSTTKTVQIEVVRAPLEVTAGDATRSYGAANPSFTATYDGFVNGDDADDLGGTLSVTTTATPSSPVGLYPITPSGRTSSNYEITNRAGTLVVTKAPTPVTWSGPDPIRYGQALSAAQLDAATGVPGTFAYSPAAGTVLDAGEHDLSVTFTPTDTTNYQPSSKTVQIEVEKAPLTVSADDVTRVFGVANPDFAASYDGFVNGDDEGDLGGTLAFATEAEQDSPAGDYDVSPSGLTSSNYAIEFVPGTLRVTAAGSTITWDDPAPITYGEALSATQLAATAGVAGVFSYSPTAGIVLPAGTHDITVTFTPTSGNHSIATQTVQIEVEKAPLTVTVRAASREVGAANPAFEVDYDGFVNGDDEGDLGGTLAFDTDADVSSPVGDYGVTPAGLTAGNYEIEFVPGTLTVTKLTPQVTWAAPASIRYGEPLTATQLDASPSVSGEVEYTPALGTVLPAGEHQLSATFTPADGDIYRSVIRTVSLVVTKAPLTVTTQDATRPFGAANPAFGVAYDGFVNGDDAGDLGGTLTFDTDADTSSPAGDYGVMPAGLTSSDYEIEFVPGTLTVAKAASVISWSDPAAIEYGTALSAAQLGATASVPGTFGYAPALGTVLPAGGHDLTVTFTPSDGDHQPATRTVRIQVTKAPLTVTARNARKVFGQANPAFTATFTGLLNGDTPASLGGTLAFSTRAAKGSRAGGYPVTPSGLTSVNYAPTYVAGVLTVTPTRVTLTGRDVRLAAGAKARPITLTGVLTSATTGDRLARVRVTFSVARAGGGKLTCSGVTNAKGLAKCRTKPVKRADVRGSTYVLRSAATGDAVAGSGKGRLRR